MSQDPDRQMTEEELQALEAEIDRIHVDDVILQTIVSLINLGARKGAVGAPPEAGLTPDLEQLRTAIEAARALLAVVEPRHGAEIGPIRDAVSQLQMAYARGASAGAAPAGPPPAGGPGGAPGPSPGGPGDADAPGGPDGPGDGPEPQGGQGPGPAQRSGRLWVPGQ